MQISFGAKIPISTCKIYNRQEKKFVPAVFYEIDCKDKSDVDFIKSLPEPWIYRRNFIYGILHKHYLFSQRHEDGPDKIYSIEDKDGYITSLCQTTSNKDSVNIEFIESSPSKKYKFSGQAMLALVAKQIFSEGKDLTVEIPAFEAKQFYEKVCKFDKDSSKEGYILKKCEIPDFIKRTKIRTTDIIV